MLLIDPLARPIIGHRGAAGEYPENTLLAFDRALEQGADALELDVRTTADGVAVVMHDTTVDRTTNGSGAVRAFTLEQLKRLDAGGGQRIPEFSEVLERYPKTPLIVEIKEWAAARPVAQLVERFGAARRILFAAFRHSALEPFRGSGHARAASRREVAVFWVASRLGPSWRGWRFQAFAVPEHFRRLRVVDCRFGRAAAQAGKAIHVWTVNHPDDARRLRALGVAGIITDFPGRLRGALSA